MPDKNTSVLETSTDGLKITRNRDEAVPRRTSKRRRYQFEAMTGRRIDEHVGKKQNLHREEYRNDKLYNRQKHSE